MNNQKWKNISVIELHDHWQQWQLVDIRDHSSFSQGHIPGAVNLNNDNLQNYINEHDFDKPLVAICYVGNSSKGAAETLFNAGFEQVYSLDGGMALWQNEYPDLVQQ